jgi:hypothetical protein
MNTDKPADDLVRLREFLDETFAYDKEAVCYMLPDDDEWLEQMIAALPIPELEQDNKRTKENPYGVERLVTLDLKQVEALSDMFGGEQTEVTLAHIQFGHSGAGLYGFYTEYPEEGCVRLLSEDEAEKQALNGKGGRA